MTLRSFSIIDAPQRSEEWRAARVGLVTASRAADVVAAIKPGEAAARRDYRMQLVCERLTQRPQDSDYVNAEMQRGIDMEPAARAAYEAVTGEIVRETGFLRHDSLAAGCSLDGDLDDFRVVVSLKCPKSSTHLRYLRGGEMPAEYVPQMLHELFITGAEFYDFLSYDDRFPERLQTFYVRVPRDAAAVAAYAEKLMAFLSEVDRDHAAVRTMADLGGTLAAAAGVTA